MSDTILVKVADGMAGSKAVELPTGATVEDAICEAGFAHEGKSITINQSAGNTDDQVREGDRIALTRGAKNNS